MAKYLVIVESPAKVKTIKKFLGANYDVEASNGHVRDFPKSQFGIDVEHPGKHSEKSYSQTSPKRNENHDSQNIIRGLQPLNRFFDQTEI